MNQDELVQKLIDRLTPSAAHAARNDQCDICRARAALIQLRCDAQRYRLAVERGDIDPERALGEPSLPYIAIIGEAVGS